MNLAQWQGLLDIIEGKTAEPTCGFIIDSPWLPGWVGCDSISFYSSDETWFNAHLKAANTFPDAMFLPGFWSEYGEITEPSAFGCKLSWEPENLPHPHQIISSIEDIEKLSKPNAEIDGVLPLALNRLKVMQPKINEAGHQIKFAVARGPLNVATFLMGTSEFFVEMMMHPDEIHKLLRIITDFTIDWLRVQKRELLSIEGIMLLDDLVGFLGEPQCSEFVAPYYKELYRAFPAKVNFFHNDSDGLIFAKHFQEVGINLVNFSFKHSMNEMREAAGDQVVLLGNIPPRDVLAVYSPDEIRKYVHETMRNTDSHKRVIWSVGGGVPQDVPTENMRAFIDAVKEF